MMAFYETLLPQSAVYVVLLFALVLIGLYGLDALVSVPYPKGVPLLREPPGATRFSLKTRIAYYTDCAALYKEAYENVSHQNHDLRLQ